jgi:rubrerythrin
MYSYFETGRRKDQLVCAIAQAIKGEFEAIHYYAKLIELAPTKEEKEQIREIRRDEKKHYRIFIEIYRNLTGSYPPRPPMPSLPTSYKEGVLAAFKDEQKTADFYLDIADQTKDPYIRQQFTRAAHDEQNHAVWFLYYYLTA